MYNVLLKIYVNVVLSVSLALSLFSRSVRDGGWRAHLGSEGQRGESHPGRDPAGRRKIASRCQNGGQLKTGDFHFLNFPADICRLEPTVGD